MNPLRFLTGGSVDGSVAVEGFLVLVDSASRARFADMVWDAIAVEYGSIFFLLCFFLRSLWLLTLSLGRCRGGGMVEKKKKKPLS